MKKMIAIVIALLMTFVFCVGKSTGSKIDTAAVDEKIVMASDYFFGNPVPVVDNSKNGVPGLRCLLDAVNMMIPEAGFTDEVTGNYSGLLTLVNEKGELQKDTYAAFLNLYKLMNGGKEFIFPIKEVNFDKVKEYAKKRLKSSRELLKAGDYKESVKALIEVVVMVVTPVKKVKRGSN